MNLTGPRATPRPVENPPADVVEVMDGGVEDVPLFGGYEPPSSDHELSLSAGQRLTLRQADQVATGVHPLTRGRLHPDADTTRTATSSQDGSPTCGTCAFREHLGHHDGRYPKCTRPGAPVSNGPATDVRAWWPGCQHHAPKAGA